MKVKDLIKILSAVDPDMDVYALYDFGITYHADSIMKITETKEKYGFRPGIYIVCGDLGDMQYIGSEKCDGITEILHTSEEEEYAKVIDNREKQK